MKTSLPVLLAGALVAACSSGGGSNAAPALNGVPPSSQDPPGQDPPDASGSTADGGGVTPDGSTPEPDGLPFPYSRPQAGTPVPANELAAITDKYIQLLTQTRYFDTVDERVHGWPESDPQKRYWYGTWWSGCGLDKANGVVTYNHVNVGADNNGIPTSSVLEGMCQAHRLWPSAKLEKLVRRLVRGLNAYSLAMKRSPNDTAGVMLARTVYPEPIAMTDGGRNAFIRHFRLVSLLAENSGRSRVERRGLASDTPALEGYLLVNGMNPQDGGARDRDDVREVEADALEVARRVASARRGAERLEDAGEERRVLLRERRFEERDRGARHREELLAPRPRRIREREELGFFPGGRAHDESMRVAAGETGRGVGHGWEGVQDPLIVA
jgi:hypothetical protein